MALDGTFAWRMSRRNVVALAEIYSNPGGAAGGRANSWRSRQNDCRSRNSRRPQRQPLDLGTVEPVMAHSPQIGETAQPLEVKTEDGKTFKLADHRGQYVLLDFEPYNARMSQIRNVAAVWHPSERTTGWSC